MNAGATPIDLGRQVGQPGVGVQSARDAQDAVADIVASVPKAELHCHMDGVVDPAILLALGARGEVLPLQTARLEAVYPVDTFERFIAYFEAGQPLAGRLDLYRGIVEIQLARLRAQRTVYVELMVASGELSLDPEAAVDALAAFREWLETACAPAEGRERIEFELLIAFNRKRPPEHAARVATRNLRLWDAGLIGGIALAGPETGAPVAPLAAVFDRYHEAGVGIEIHAAEWCGSESAWDALQHGHPRRLGHATHVFDDPKLVDEIRTRGIHLEMCPTSNVCTGSIARLEDHPLRHAIDLGLSVSLSTDDPGAFRNSLAGEYAIAASVFGFSAAELARLTENALAARFRRLH